MGSQCLGLKQQQREGHEGGGTWGGSGKWREEEEMEGEKGQDWSGATLVELG